MISFKIRTYLLCAYKNNATNVTLQILHGFALKTSDPQTQLLNIHFEHEVQAMYCISVISLN